MEHGIRLLSSCDIYKWDKRRTFDKAGACVQHRSLVRRTRMVLSYNNFNENISPAVMGAKSGVGWASTRQNTQFLEEMAQRASTHKGIPSARPYFPKDVVIKDVQLHVHGFCDTSEVAYFSIVYLRAANVQNNIHVALVIAKTKVAPFKHLSIPRLQLCGAVMVSKLLHHMAKILEVPLSNIFAWTDSRITLGGLQGNPRGFLTFVGNWVAEISEAIPMACWHHVKGGDNTADCLSSGMFPAELVEHNLWRRGHQWLRDTKECWNVKVSFNEHPVPSEERDVQQTLLPVITANLLLLKTISSYSHLVRVTAWILCFFNNARKKCERDSSLILSLSELKPSEETWCMDYSKVFIWGRNLKPRKWERIVTKKQNHTLSPIIGQSRITAHWWEASKGKVAFWRAPPRALNLKPQGN